MSDFNRTKGHGAPMPKPRPNTDTREEWAARFGAWPLSEILCESKHGRETYPSHVHSRRPDPEIKRRRSFVIDPLTGQWINRPPSEPGGIRRKVSRA